MGYSSAVLIKIDDQSMVNEGRFVEFCEAMRESGLLPYADEVLESCNPPQVGYFYCDEEADEEEEYYCDVVSLDTIKKFVLGKNIDFCSIHIEGGSKDLQQEFEVLLEDLGKYGEPYFKPAWKFGYGFERVVDPVGGVVMGWSFFIDTSDYIPEYSVLDEVFSKGKKIGEIRKLIEGVFGCSTSIEGCFTG